MVVKLLTCCQQQLNSKNGTLPPGRLTSCKPTPPCPQLLSTTTLHSSCGNEFCRYTFCYREWYSLSISIDNTAFKKSIPYSKSKYHHEAGTVWFQTTLTFMGAESLLGSSSWKPVRMVTIPLESSSLPP